ncbi:MAG: RNA binding protein, heterogenous nuclear RNP-K like protein [Cyphobasidiales sp. Tagirdzhanova-0007]|nr:MAG: RNA binding protein, heterogenous nuclear RNP-K like protein [Cyphobasidiales sp. Tagirdzhanova-0007]
MTSEVLPPPPAAGGDVKMDATSSDTTPNLGSSGSPPLGSSNQNHQFTLRALVSSKEAGVIIGKAGKNVADLREATGCKAGVSKVLPGVQERVLSVTGPLEAVCKAYASILANMSENPSAQNEGFASGISSSISIKLLVANAIMGSVIGKAGATIQALQAKHSSKIVTVKEMLPNSTERIVSVEGSVSAVESTVQELARIVSEQDSNRLSNHILYQPGSSAANTSVSGGQPGGPGGFLGGGPLVAGVFNQNGSGPRRNTGPNNGVTRSAGGANASQAVPTPSNPDLRTQNISIPSDMVGCIIGRGGSKINEIRLQSGAKISIAKDAHDESGERMFTITGSSEALEKALFLLYGQLEGEKEKRIQNQKQEMGS